MLQINNHPRSFANALTAQVVARPMRVQTARILRQDSWPTLPLANPGIELVAPARKKLAPQLQAGRWSPHNRAYLNAFLESLSHAPRGAERPAAVFDWDETSMLGDTVNTWLHSTFEHLEITLTPTQLRATLDTHIGAREHLLSGIHLPSLCEDIVDAHTALHPFIMAGDIAGAQQLPAYHDFRTKMAIYYDQYYYDPENPYRDSYTWLQWFQGLHQDTLAARVSHAFDTYAKHDAPTATWQTATPGRTGILSHTFKTKPAKTAEMVDLMRCLRRAGADVYVMSGSIEPCVQALAHHLGYPIKRENIFGSHALFDAAGYLTGAVVSPDIYPPCWKAGKSAVIERYVKRHPVLVAGDSDGDVHMLSHFADTQVRLIIDHKRRGAIQAFYEAGAILPNAQVGNVRTLVQAWL